MWTVSLNQYNANSSTPIIFYTEKKKSDELMHERAKNKMLQEEMEATLHDIQNM